MTVCLHCGELGADGALFCTKCGYTLPQVDPSVTQRPSPSPPSAQGVPAGSTPAPTGPTHPPTASPSMPMVWPYAPGGYAALSSSVPGAVGPMPPPPAGKYCIRCRTVISRVAVYCPVCQQPQS